MSGVVLDASALLALLLQERGAAKVARSITEARISAINYAEVVGHFVQLGMPPATIDAMLAPLPIEVVPVDRALARIAGGFAALSPGAPLPLGDRCCLALAHRDGLPAWTCDPSWSLVSEAAGVKVVSIR